MFELVHSQQQLALSQFDGLDSLKKKRDRPGLLKARQQIVPLFRQDLLLVAELSRSSATLPSKSVPAIATISANCSSRRSSCAAG